MKPLLIVSMLLLVGCGGTEHTRRTFPVEVMGKPGAVVTDSGWSVALTTATAHLESVRFFEGKVLVTRRAPWWRSLLVSEAWAHPGHYQPGEALAELLAPLELDLLATGPVRWGDASALTGSYGSMQLGFGAGGLQLEGVATRGAETVDFSAQYTPESALDGVAFDYELTTAPGTMQLHLDLQALLSRIDFAQVDGSITVDSVAFNGLVRGMGDINAYLVSWRNEP